MRQKIENILKDTLPANCFIFVGDRKSIFGEPEIRIGFAAMDYNINNVQGQRPQMVSLLLSLNDMELKPQIFGGNGGQCIYRDPNKNDPKERYLAMKSVKVPFKMPKKEEKFVLAAIKRFAENWIKTLKENREVLRYRDIVNYDELLK